MKFNITIINLSYLLANIVNLLLFWQESFFVNVYRSMVTTSYIFGNENFILFTTLITVLLSEYDKDSLCFGKFCMHPFCDMHNMNEYRADHVCHKF